MDKKPIAIKDMYKILCLTIILIFTQNIALASTITIEAPEHAKQGSAILVTAISQLPINTIIFYWLEKKIPTPFKKSGSLWKAQTLLPIPIDAIGNKDLIIQAQSYSAQRKISIDKVSWPVHNITISKDKEHIDLPNNVKKRIEEEQKIITKTLENISSIQYWSKPFIRPVSGIITSPFGVRRHFNGKRPSFNYHTGVDLRGAIGTPIKAVAAGKVVLLKELYNGGKTVIIDHGQGIFTTYCHMSRCDTQIGKTVTTGQKIGLVGMTGRTTGPHLHLELNILGYYVNPMSIFPTKEGKI